MLPPKQADFAGVAGNDENAEFAVRDCRLQWRLPADIAETDEVIRTAENADIGKNAECRPRLPGLSILPAENGRLHAEIENVE